MEKTVEEPKPVPTPEPVPEVKEEQISLSLSKTLLHRNGINIYFIEMVLIKVKLQQQ